MNNSELPVDEASASPSTKPANTEQPMIESGFVLLSELPRGDPLRSLPLGELAAECRSKRGKEWKAVARWRIATCPYDELGPSWTETSDFRVPR